MDDLIFFGFILSFALILSAFFLSLVYYLRKKVLWKYKTLLFIGFCTVLYFISGIQYYLVSLKEMSAHVLTLTFVVINNILYALLIYYLPATLNYMLKRSWKLSRLIMVCLTCGFYMVLSIIMIFYHNVGILYETALGILLVSCIIGIIVDALKSMPLIEHSLDRMVIGLLFGLTFVFLPLLLLGRLISLFTLEIFQDNTAAFGLHCLYFFWMAVILIFYLAHRLTKARDYSTALDARPEAFFSQWGITPRERQIVLEIEKGYTNKEISAELNISANTVSNHVASIYKKVGARSRVELLNLLRKEPS